MNFIVIKIIFNHYDNRKFLDTNVLLHKEQDIYLQSNYETRQAYHSIIAIW